MTLLKELAEAAPAEVPVAEAPDADREHDRRLGRIDPA
jgi:hypothetical protein